MALRGSSYGGGAATSGNKLQQLYALSGQATLNQLPWLYGQGGNGIGGGGREKGGAGGAFMGQPQAAEGPGPGSGGGGFGVLAQPPQELPGPFPADTNGAFPSAVNPAWRHQSGEGGDFSGSDALRTGAADLTFGNLASAAGFGLGLMSGEALPMLGVQLAADQLLGTGSPLPSFQGQFNPSDYLTAEEISQLSGALNSTQARHIQARLMGLARARHDAEMGDRSAAQRGFANDIKAGFQDTRASGFQGPAGPVGATDNPLAGGNIGLGFKGAGMNALNGFGGGGNANAGGRGALDSHGQVRGGGTGSRGGGLTAGGPR